MLAVGFVGADEKDEKAEEERAELGCTILKTAVEAYSVSPQNPECTDATRFPTKLTDLIKPPFGERVSCSTTRRIYSTRGEVAYKYAVGKGEDDTPLVYVWTERTVDGWNEVIGKKPPEQKRKSEPRRTLAPRRAPGPQLLTRPDRAVAALRSWGCSPALPLAALTCIGQVRSFDPVRACA